jgi:AAA15 family ATPase/GTPase
MLQQFTVSNWASFKGPMTLSLEASSDTEHEETNVIDVCEKRLLKSAVIYGANASGKSNLISAMQFFRTFTLSSSREGQIEEEIATEPFLLSTDYESKPSHFEATFIHNRTRFRYGFEVDRKRVHSEWLFSTSSSREAELFVREEDQITCNPERFKEGKSLGEKTRPNALFLSVVAQFNGEVATSVMKWFLDFRFISATRNPALRFTVERLSDPSFAARVLDMSKIADLGIEGLIPKISSAKEDEGPFMLTKSGRKAFLSRAKDVELKMQHKKFDSNNQSTGLVEFDLEKDESEGTKKYFSMTGPLIDALEAGRVLVVDELDARLHPLLSRAIVLLFNNTKNASNAQLIFATHDTNLLTRQLFRRDQVWFTEKDPFGATDLYSLSEFRVRKDASFGKDYILGKFGAIPFIGDLNTISFDAKTVE